MKLDLDVHALESLYTTMVKIRRFDERTTELFVEGLVKGTAHSYVGEEAVAAAACANLREGDYRTKDEEREWIERDPIAAFKSSLVEGKHATPMRLKELEEAVEVELDHAVEFGKQSAEPSVELMEAAVYAPHVEVSGPEPPAGNREITMAEALNEAIRGEMERDERVFVMGEDVQIVNQAAKFRFMLGGKPTVPVVIRGPQGGGIRLAAQHSQSKALGSVRKTHRFVVVHEAVKRGGFGAELAALVCEQALDDLDAPVARVASRAVPMPYNDSLERATIPTQADVVTAVRGLF